MSSWGAAAQWLTVAGSSLLAFGTWSQARASIIEYRDLFADLPQAARAALDVSKASRLTILRARGISLITPVALASEIPRQLEQIRQEHGDAAARAAAAHPARGRLVGAHRRGRADPGGVDDPARPRLHLTAACFPPVRPPPPARSRTRSGARPRSPSRARPRHQGQHRWPAAVNTGQSGWPEDPGTPALA